MLPYASTPGICAISCHLGNIAYRTHTVVRCDPKTGKMIDNPEGEKLWKRASYRSGWDVKV